MEPFLSSLSKHIFNHFGHQMDQLTLVFPNRRAGLFFRKYLSENLKQPIWSPQILSLEDFVKQLSPLQPEDKLALIFRLYHVFIQFSRQNETFDQFYFWGDMLLQDFDDIDKYMVNPRNLFINIKEQKKLDETFDYLTEAQKSIILRFWKNFYDHPSREKDQFIKIWDILNEVYDAFTQSLVKARLGYTGLIYRHVVDAINAEDFNAPFEKIIFAGFNALTKSEEIIISWFIESGKAEIFWDIDDYYVSNDHHEAGTFFREYKDKPAFRSSFKEPAPSLMYDGKEKVITMTGVSLSAGQAKIMGEDMARSMKEGLAPEKTVIILPEEHLLFPVLHALPEPIKKINVTMGFPLRNTPFYSLFEHLLEMQSYVQIRHGVAYFPHRQVVSILKHPLFKSMDIELAEKNIRDIEKFNKIHISEQSLHMDHRLYPIVFRAIKRGHEIFDYLMEIMLEINAYNVAEEHQIENEYAYQFYLQLNRLKEISREQGIELPVKAFLRLFRQLVQSLRIPFSGEPLEGLQIMGVLETRNLDFDNVYILSMNEGAFPATPRLHSYIPYNLRKAYQLPTYDHQDAIYAYLFYRIIQRAKKVNLYYNTESGLGIGGEMSRFLQQLIYESPFRIQKRILNNNIELPLPKSITISKREEVFKKLKEFTSDDSNPDRRLTPSAINTYLDCKFKFYLRHVAVVREPDKLEDEVDPRVFGNLLHQTMEKLYADFIRNHGSKVTAGDFKEILNKVDTSINHAFNRQYNLREGTDFIFEGRNILVKSMIKKFVTRILEKDQQYAPFELLGLEANEAEGFIANMPIMNGGKEISVGLKGIIDRIDRKEDVVRVIDYKTGKDDKDFDSIAGMFMAENPKRNKAAMQVIFYALLYLRKSGQSGLKIQPGIINAKQLFSDDFDTKLVQKDGLVRGNKIPIEDVSPLIDQFQNELTGLLQEIFDPQIPFTQTEDTKICRNCPYNGICHRN